MILTYRVLTNLIYPFLIIFVYLRKIFNKEDKFRFKEKIFPAHFNVIKNRNKRLIWFHAASIGEFKSITPIIEELNKSNNDLEFLITTVTISSSFLVQEKFKTNKNIHHRFLPFDIGFLMKKFFKLWNPEKIFLVDSEIWPNMILIARENKIPIAIINARLTTKTFTKWNKFPKTAKMIFNNFDLCLTSNNETKDYLKKLGAKNIFFNGNLKLINNIDYKKIKNLNEKFLTSKRFWFAASTHEGEDLFCFDTHRKIREKYEDIVTIIAPRHINKVENIKSLAQSFNLKTQILNNDELILDNKEIIIINSIGILQNYFKYAKSVFIGKSVLRKLKNEGGQNPIDAAKLKCKIYHGPYVYNFEEIYRILEKNGISHKIRNAQELSENLIEDLRDHQKEDSKISEIIENLSQTTFIKTMKNINNFINDF